MLPELLNGLANVFHPMTFLLMVFGTIVGVVIGALPGLSGSTGIILLLPLVMGIDGIMYAAPVADFIAAILALVFMRHEFGRMKEQDQV